MLMTNTEALLLEEFKRLHDLYMRSRIKRNERINFFVGISTAVGSGLVFLGQMGTLAPSEFQCLALLSLALLGMLGVIVHRDLVRSEINSAIYLKSIDLIKHYFAQSDEKLKDYLVFPGIVDGASSFTNKKHFWSSTNPLFIQILASILWGSVISLVFLCVFPGIWQWFTAVVFVGVCGLVTILLRRWAFGQLAKAEKLITQIQSSASSTLILANGVK